jgi:uncharacterized protein (TIGR00255 family)
MTGFGKEILLLPAKKITIEIKSLNSKTLDLNLRLPASYREKEMALRNLLAAHVSRGKVDFSMFMEITGAADVPRLNAAVVAGYLAQLEAIKEETGMHGDTLNAIMRLPEILSADKDEVNPEEWAAIEGAVMRAVARLNEFRAAEGLQLAADLHNSVNAIENLMQAVLPFEGDRLKTIRERIEKNLEQIAEKPEPNRLEQEFIFYMEKFDINEEKVRLQTHLNYFREIMANELENGRKLGFVSQELGREINTLGSKANHAQIQKLVVQMKDHLEKIKEQLLNVL